MLYEQKKEKGVQTMCRQITASGDIFNEPFNYCQIWASQNGIWSLQMNGEVFVPSQPGIQIQLHAGEYNTQNFVFAIQPGAEGPLYVNIIYTMYDGYDAINM